MKKEKIILYIWLATSFSYGSNMPHIILKHYNGNLEYFYENIEFESALFKISEKSLEKLNKKDLSKAEHIFNLCEKLNINILTYYEEKYPEKLREIASSPIVLYYIGNLNTTFAPCVSIVGTRRCNEFGLNSAKTLTRKLVSYGITTISGCAIGIDKTIHLETINSNGLTIAVLGTALDSKYPFQNRELKKNIIKKNGLILSEYPPQEETKAWHFPIRNRIISAISDCVVVIQSKEKSGTIITAKKALEFKKKLFCIPPANIFDENSKGIKKCLEKGAKLLLDINDILKIFENSKYKLTNAKNPSEEEKNYKTFNIPKEFESLFEIITEETKLEDILKKTNYKTSELLFMLTQMELLNYIEKTKIGYKRCIN